MVGERTSFETEARHAWKSLQEFAAARKNPSAGFDLDWARDEIEAIVSCTTRVGIRRLCEAALEAEAAEAVARLSAEAAKTATASQDKEAGCDSCRHLSSPAHREPCDSCLLTNVGYPNFEPAV